MIKVKYPIALVCSFIWIGFVCAISFMEAWLKFRAPGITLPLGLGIGRLVFSALNKVEWFLAIGIFFNFLSDKKRQLEWSHLLFVLALIILIVQTSYALPALDLRADMHIKGQIVPSSNLHFLYVVMEFVKVISLLIFGIKLFKLKNVHDANR